MQARLRLRRRADFARVREHGKSWQHPLAVLSVVVRDDGETDNRYGVIASRSVGKAIRRSRARRLLREALRQNHPHIRPGHDIVLIARAAIVGKTFADVNLAVRELLGRAQLLVAPDVLKSEEA